jgi:hypothetical protein
LVLYGDLGIGVCFWNRQGLLLEYFYVFLHAPLGLIKAIFNRVTNTRRKKAKTRDRVQTTPLLGELPRFENSRNVEMTALAAMLTVAGAQLERNESRRGGSTLRRCG